MPTTRSTRLIAARSTTRGVSAGPRPAPPWSRPTPGRRLLLRRTGPMEAASSTSADTRAGRSRRSPNTTGNTFAGSVATRRGSAFERRSSVCFASRLLQRNLAEGARSSDAGEELKHSLGQHCGRLRVVGGERVVGEVVLIAGVQEELSVLDLLDDLAGGLDVSLAHEDRVVVHSMDLDGNALWPWPEGPLAADRDAGVEEECAPSSRARLGKLLRDHLAEREPRVHQVLRQVVCGAFAPLDQLIHAAGLDVGHSLVDAPEGAPVEQVGRMHRVPGATQVLR